MLRNPQSFTILRNQIVFSAARLSKVLNVVKHGEAQKWFSDRPEGSIFVLVEHGRCNRALLYLKESKVKRSEEEIVIHVITIC